MSGKITNETLARATMTDVRARVMTAGYLQAMAYPGTLFGGGSSDSVEDRGQRERGSVGGSPLVRGSVGSCNLVQEISFHIVKSS